MKKLVFVFVACAAISFASCGNKAANSTEAATEPAATETVESAAVDSTAAAPADSTAAVAADSTATAE